MTTIVLSQINSLEMHTLRLLFGPGVYTVWNKDKPLYVGSAKNLMHRISHPKHKQLRMALDEATRIEFSYCGDESWARRQEAKRIIELQPKYNQRGKTGSSWLSP